MNSRSSNGASLPYFGNNSNGRRLGGNTSNNIIGTSNSNPITKRISPAKFMVFLGLCVLSLLALSRLFTPVIDSPVEQPDMMEEPKDDLEQKQLVQQILASRKSSFLFDDFTEDGLAKPGNEHLLPTTAVLLGWKRPEGLKLIVNYLGRYPYIKQIIVWNNNKDTKLSKRDFSFDSSFGPQPELQVYNAAENLHDIAKYMSCSLAKYKHCYLQDDDWLNTHMDALYSNFLTSPNLLHTNTQPLIQMEHRRWTFTNESTGSYIPQEKAQRLLTQRGNSTLPMERSKVIDMYFSIWTNQYPYQLVNYLTELDQKKEWSSEEVDNHWSTVFINMLDAADRLYSALVGHFEVTDKDYFARTQELPAVEDRQASIDPFPHPKEVIFKGDIKTIDEQNSRFLELDYPTNQFWATFSYVHAVDNDPLTCWNSFKIPQEGDSFGLRFVQPTLVRHLTVTSSKSLTSLEGQISVLVSDRRGEHWTICTQTTKFPFVHTMTLEITCPPVGPNIPANVVDMIKIQFDNNLEKSLEICGMDAGGMVL
ncbi:hypothetical protein BG004_002922 [Podila humilis]|nr:hypothetical protein BG004_002922 [Podila humilis]